MSVNKTTSTSTAFLPSLLTHELARFREQLEAEASEPICAIDTNVALVLSDLCYFFKLDTAQREQILGGKATSCVTATLETEISIAYQRSPLPSSTAQTTPAYEPNE